MLKIARKIVESKAKSLNLHNPNFKDSDKIIDN